MVVEQIDNPANRNMHYGDKVSVGTISAPSSLPKRVLYSNKEAERIYSEMQHDIYQTQKHTKKPSKGKFPMVLKILIGAGLLAGIVTCRKNLWSKFKSLFSKT
jgi:hypothetical protein